MEDEEVYDMPKRDFSKPEGSSLKYDRDLYSASISSLVFNEKEARTEYARLRRFANERIKTLQKYGYGDANSLKRFPKSFESARGASEKQVRKMLSDVAHFMDLQTTSLRGIQRQQRNMIDALQERGYDFINKNNVQAFGRFMDAAKRHYGSKKAYDSEQIVEIFEQMEKEIRQMEPDEMESVFEEWTLSEEGPIPNFGPDDMA